MSGSVGGAASAVFSSRANSPRDRSGWKFGRRATVEANQTRCRVVRFSLSRIYSKSPGAAAAAEPVDETGDGARGRDCCAGCKEGVGDCAVGETTGESVGRSTFCSGELEA